MSYDNPGSIRKSSMPLLLSSYEKSYDNVTWITPTKIPTKNLAKCPTWIAKVRTNNHYRKNFRRCLRSWREYQIFVRSRIFVRKFLRKLSTWIRPLVKFGLAAVIVPFQKPKTRKVTILAFDLTWELLRSFKIYHKVHVVSFRLPPRPPRTLAAHW